MCSGTRVRADATCFSAVPRGLRSPAAELALPEALKPALGPVATTKAQSRASQRPSRDARGLPRFARWPPFAPRVACLLQTRGIRAPRYPNPVPHLRAASRTSRGCRGSDACARAPLGSAALPRVGVLARRCARRRILVTCLRALPRCRLDDHRRCAARPQRRLRTINVHLGP